MSNLVRPAVGAAFKKAYYYANSNPKMNNAIPSPAEPSGRPNAAVRPTSHPGHLTPTLRRPCDPKPPLAAVLAVILVLSVAPAPALAQPPAYPTWPAHPGAVFRTAMPTLDSVGPAAQPTSTAPVQPSATVSPATTFSGATYTVGPTVTPTTTIPEAEEHIAVDPNNPNTLVAAISDYSLRPENNGSGLYANTTKYAFSLDNGATWTEAFVALDPNGFPNTSDGYSWEANSDPVVAIDRSGHVYMADLYLNISNNANGFYVNVDNNISDGVTFTAAQTYPVAVNPDPATPNLEDKPWIGVDNSSSVYGGNVYVSWTRFYTVTNTVTGHGGKTKTTVQYLTGIFFSRSTDHGATWSTPFLISQNGVQGSQVATGPDGTVYVVWDSASQQFLSKSTNGGLTFSAPVAISPQFNSLSFSSTYRKNSFPALAVDPVSGAVYVAYADQPSTASQIEFIASYDGGATFTAPVALDDDNSTGQRLMPALAVDETGTIHCSWFDTRNSPDGSAQYYDIYATYSSNGGTSFAPNARVTAATLAVGTGTFIGDYSGVAAEGGYAHPVWTSGGNHTSTDGMYDNVNLGQLQTASLILPTTPDFVLSASPAEESVAPGSQASYAVTIDGSPAFNANNRAVTLAVSGLPAGAGYAFSSPSVTGSGSSTLTVSLSSATTLGSYPLTITGTSGALSHAISVLLDVQNPDFSLAVSPASVTLPTLAVANGTGTPSWTATNLVGITRVSGFADSVNFSVAASPALPVDASASFNPNPAAGDSSTLALTVPATTSAGTYSLTITGIGTVSGLTHTATTSLVVSGSPTTVSVVSPWGTSGGGYAVSGGPTGMKNLTVTVTLLDNFGQPVPGASVSISLTATSATGTTVYSGSATTDISGNAAFTVRNAPAGSYTTTVTGVTASGLTWDGMTPDNSYFKTQ